MPSLCLLLSMWSLVWPPDMNSLSSLLAFPLSGHHSVHLQPLDPRNPVALGQMDERISFISSSLPACILWACTSETLKAKLWTSKGRCFSSSFSFNPLWVWRSIAEYKKCQYTENTRQLLYSPTAILHINTCASTHVPPTNTHTQIQRLVKLLTIYVV